MRQNLFDSNLEDCVIGAKGLKARSGTATSVAGAATMTQMNGKITTEALSQAAGASFTLTVTNPNVAATDMIQATINGGTFTAGTPIVKAVAGAGQYIITITNAAGAAAFNGTMILAISILKVGAP